MRTNLKRATLIAICGFLVYNVGKMSIFRNAVWFVKGLREYTKSGYENAAKTFNLSDMDIDCSSKSFIVTGYTSVHAMNSFTLSISPFFHHHGANSGIGYEAALEIAKRNGTLHLVCRNESLGTKAKNELIEKTKNEKIHLHIVDMSQSKQIVEFTSSFASKHQLNVLINNAGALFKERKMTDDDLEASFATNTLGYFLMTKGLLDLLSKSDDPRVLFVSSGGMLVQKLEYADLNSEKTTNYDGVMVYAQNKRQQVVMCEEFAKSYPKIFFASTHPGWADTPGVQSSLPGFYEKMKGKLRTASQGADTLAWLAVSPTAKNFPSGSFFQDRTPVATHLPLAWTKTSDAENAEFMNKLAEISTKL